MSLPGADAVRHRLPAEPLPEAARRRLTLAFERAADVDSLVVAALEVLGNEAAGVETEDADLDPKAGNWRGRLECLYADHVMPLRRHLQQLCRETAAERSAVAGHRGAGSSRSEAEG